MFNAKCKSPGEKDHTEGVFFSGGCPQQAVPACGLFFSPEIEWFWSLVQCDGLIFFEAKNEQPW